MATEISAMADFKFGADPELFVYDTSREKFVTAAGLIPGTKEEPYKVRGGAVQVDGMAAEFNIDPVNTFYDFNKNFHTVIDELGRMLPKDHVLRAVPSVQFDQDEWDKAPEVAKELGCSPDYNAWTGEVNPPPEYKAAPTLRTAAGHLHIGWTEDDDSVDHILNCRDLVKQLDYFLGAWSINKDPDPLRRKLYGKAGACRYKPYGVEYRVLSNFWVLTTPGRREVWNRMQKAIWEMQNRFLPEKTKRFDFNDRLVRSINESVLDPQIVRHFKFPIGSLNDGYSKF